MFVDFLDAFQKKKQQLLNDKISKGYFPISKGYLCYYFNTLFVMF